MHRFPVYLSIAYLWLLGADASAQTAIVPDQSLGAEASIVQSRPGFDVITGGATRGDGLFHSFTRFSVGDRGASYFLVRPEVQNIFARVTGNTASTISGSLGVRVNNADFSNSTASLFLLNPNGIVFGPNAKLDLAGSFLATTANRIQFASGQEFGVVNPQGAPMLTVSVPLGLKFGENSNDIRVEGTRLSAGKGKTLGLVGGGVQISSKAFIIAESGRIDIGAVGPRESVNLEPDQSGWAIDYRTTGGFRDITINDSIIFGDGSTANGDPNFFLNSSNFISNNSSIAISKNANKSDGNISITARGSTLLKATDGNQAIISVINKAQLAPSGGDIKITTPVLSVLGGASIGTTISGQGKAGNIDIEAAEKIVIEGSLRPAEFSSGSTILSGISREGIGRGGLIKLKSKNIEILNGGSVGSINLGTGTTGEIELVAREDIIVSGATAVGSVSSISNQSIGSPIRGLEKTTLPPGIKLSANNLVMRDGGSVSTNSFSNGDSRDIVIDVQNEVRVQGGASFSAGGY
jgi:filamentous hemagglutinin family protein